MNHPAIFVLERFERMKNRNSSYEDYVYKRKHEIQEFIDKLSRFAAIKPESKPGKFVKKLADSFTERFHKVLKKFNLVY